MCWTIQVIYLCIHMWINIHFFEQDRSSICVYTCALTYMFWMIQIICLCIHIWINIYVLHDTGHLSLYTHVNWHTRCERYRSSICVYTYELTYMLWTRQVIYLCIHTSALTYMLWTIQVIYLCLHIWIDIYLLLYWSIILKYHFYCMEVPLSVLKNHFLYRSIISCIEVYINV